MARIDGQIGDEGVRRKRGGQPGNKNAWRHGKRSATATLRRRLSVARLKGLAHVMHGHGLLPPDDDQFRFRVRPVRDDQMELLWMYDPELAAVLTQSGWTG